MKIGRVRKMNLPTVQQIQNDHIRDCHVEAVLESIRRLSNDVPEETARNAGNTGGRIPKNGGIRQRKVSQKKQVTANKKQNNESGMPGKLIAKSS